MPDQSPVISGSSEIMLTPLSLSWIITNHSKWAPYYCACSPAVYPQLLKPK